MTQDDSKRSAKKKNPRFQKNDRYFVKYLNGSPKATFCLHKEEIHPQKLFSPMCNILVEQGYTETDFITEYDAHSEIMRQVNAAPTWREGNLILDRLREEVNAISYQELFRLAKEQVGEHP